MARLYISEYSELGSTRGRSAPVGKEPSIDQTPVTITGTSAQSAAFAATTGVVRIHTDVICSILFGANPTATTDSKRLAAGQTEEFGVTPGHKVAVISNT